MLNRREMTELLMRAAALPAANVFLCAWLRGQHAQHKGSTAPPDLKVLRNYQPKFFAAEDFGILQAFTEILIPSDEDPGAREAYCAAFMDFLLQASNEMPQTQASWRRAMEAIKETGFANSDSHRREELITEMSQPESMPGATHPVFFAYRLIKQMTVFAFYTSRVGMIDVLDYKGNSYNITFPGCNHSEHQSV